MSIEILSWGESLYAQHNGQWYRNAIRLDGWVKVKTPDTRNLSPFSQTEKEYEIHSELFKLMVLGNVKLRDNDPLDEQIAKKYNYYKRRQLPQDWLNNLKSKQRYLFDSFYLRYRDTFDEMLFAGDSYEQIFEKFIRFMDTIHEVIKQKGEEDLEIERIPIRALHKAYIDAQASFYENN